jgi:hypothetical protein
LRGRSTHTTRPAGYPSGGVPPAVERQLHSLTSSSHTAPQVRTVNYTGCGIALGDEIDMTESGAWASVPAEDRLEALTKTVYDSVLEQYNMIEGCVPT